MDKSSNKIVTPKQIEAWRNKLNKSQEEMAQIFDVSPDIYKDWESGKETPPHPNMLRLAFSRLLVEQITIQIKNDEPRFRAKLGKIDTKVSEAQRTSHNPKTRSWDEVMEEIEYYERLLEIEDRHRAWRKEFYKDRF